MQTLSTLRIRLRHVAPSRMLAMASEFCPTHAQLENNSAGLVVLKAQFEDRENAIAFREFLRHHFPGHK